MSDPTRRKLFERLRDGPCSVNELVETVSVSQPAVSQHLRVLKAARLVRVQKQGQQRIYWRFLTTKGTKEGQFSSD